MTLRKFSLGDEWLYLKIYVGVKTSDIILNEAIAPLIVYLKEENLIKKWFFIRYNDPKFHLRLRFQLTEVRNLGIVLENTNSALKEFIDSVEISNIVIDSYNRELERYGEETITIVETLFWKSSELIIKFLEYDDEEKIMISMFYIEQLLSGIKLSTKEKTEWISQSNTAFKKEFNADKTLNNQLKRKFSEFKPKYEAFIHLDEFEEIRGLITSIVSESISIECKPEREAYFFQSIFHMHINRTFVSSQRVFEMIIYDYLSRNCK